MLGYRGHFSTKSRHYSIRCGDIRQARTEQARLITGTPPPDPEKTMTVGEWHYAGSGHRHGEAFWAEVARQRIATARRIARHQADEKR
ncbi:replication initiator [Nonomuraea sp. NPDC050227]|uniref:replication initiator n=1 Tax=Nonomuraea sp. NPDC050227 TaxID=3364360 RepID=UPI0037A390C4